MSKVTKYSDFGNIKDFASFSRFASGFLSEVNDVINGNIDFSENINCVFSEVTFSSANAEVTVPHTLGKVPTGRIVVAQSAAGAVYDGSSSDATNIYLKCTATGSATVLIF